MNTTPNYNLKMPSGSDYFNIEDFNSNMRVIDTNLANSGSSQDVIAKIELASNEIKSTINTAAGNVSSSVNSSVSGVQSTANDILSKLGNSQYTIESVIDSSESHLTNEISTAKGTIESRLLGVQSIISSDITDAVEDIVNELSGIQNDYTEKYASLLSEIMYSRDEYLSGKNEVIRAIKRLDEKLTAGDCTETTRHAVLISLNSCSVKTEPVTYEEDE